MARSRRATLAFRVTRDEHKALKRAAKAAGMPSVSALIRKRLAADFLAREGTGL